MKTNDIVYGVHAVTEALLANTGNKLYLQDDLRGKNVEKVKELATERKYPFLGLQKISFRMTEGAVHQVLSYVFLNLPILNLSRFLLRLVKKKTHYY